MIQRSVPGYGNIIATIGLLAQRYAQPNSHCYDLGCSLGAAALSMCHQIDVDNCRVIAVDNSQAMVSEFKNKLLGQSEIIDLEIICADIRDIRIEKASIVVLNFTLQFVPIADRLAFLQTIHQGLLPGGVLILSEKIKSEDDRQHNLQTEMHQMFKKANGYSDLEISQKRTALENVLIPESFDMHLQRLRKAGFASADTWFKFFNFVSIIAFR